MHFNIASFAEFKSYVRNNREFILNFGALLKAGIPVVAKVGPVVVRTRVGVADETDLLDLLVAIFDRHGEPQRRAVARGKRLATHFID